MLRDRPLVRRHARVVIGIGDRLVEQALCRASGDQCGSAAAALDCGRVALQVQVGFVLVLAVALEAVLAEDRFDVLVVVYLRLFCAEEQGGG